MSVTLTTIDPILRVEDICTLLKISAPQFYKLKEGGFFDRHQLLIEVLPRIDRRPRYRGEPFARLLNDKTQARLWREMLAEVSQVMERS